MSEQIKRPMPCPFCGSLEQLIEYDSISGVSAVCCESCGAKVMARSAGSAITAWNRRAPADDLQATVEAVKVTPTATKTPRAASKYHRQIRTEAVDVYDVLTAFDVRNPAIQHAVKKLLAPGQRGAKDKLTDLREALQSIERAIQIEDAEG